MIWSDITATLAQVPILLKIAIELRPRSPEIRDCFAARFEAVANRFADRTAVTCEGETRSWRELNQEANRCAAALRALGLRRGDTVSVMMENRIALLSTIVALNKLGVTTALLNTNLTGRPLTHCMSITGSRACLFGEERLQAIAGVKSAPELDGIENYLYVADRGHTPCPQWAADLDEAARCNDDRNPPDTGENTLGDIAFYVFTSGTTGLPKAALISNRRFLLMAALSGKGGLRCDEHDCIYLCLPLYHGTGLFLGLGASFCTGASTFVRRKFSASNFLREVRENDVSCFIYIGELCRYLLQTPEAPGDSANPLRTVMGNGLRPDIWHEFKQRFGIERIAEFYGSSEGNVGFVNLLNKDCTVGTTTLPLALVEYDIDADDIVRNRKGHCIRVKRGEPGLLLGKITRKTAFEGYTSREATESKILRNVFRKGDAWFNTGDLMRTVDVGFALGMSHYQFVDRVGDTFRWKAENVSTNEVGEIINGHPQVALCNVYGVEVPGAGGRAGMAALTLEEEVGELDLQAFSDYVNRELPPYARPVFLRVLPEMDTTGTFKLLKVDLRRQGYDLAEVRDPVYVMKPGSSTYEPLDTGFLEKIRAGEAGY